MNASEQTRRVEALALLEVFCKRILPGAIRRIAAWKGLSRGQIPDLTDELRQELAVDCLLHADTVVQLAAPQRHSRWMRAAERWIYHHRLGRSQGRHGLGRCGRRRTRHRQGLGGRAGALGL